MNTDGAGFVRSSSSALFGRLRLAAGSLLPAVDDADDVSFCRSFLRSRAFQKFLISLSDLPGSLAAIWDQLQIMIITYISSQFKPGPGYIMKWPCIRGKVRQWRHLLLSRGQLPVAKCFVESNDEVLFVLGEAAPLEVRPQVVHPPQPAALAAPLQACIQLPIHSHSDDPIHMSKQVDRTGE